MFDANEFMNQSAGVALDTRIENPKEGEYTMVAEDLTLETFDRKDPTKGGPLLRCTIVWNLLDEAEKARLGREKLTCRQQFLLDLTPDGKLDFSKGKNIRLGQIYEALGMNDGSGTFERIKNSGQMVRGQLKHRADDKDSSVKYAEIVRVAKA